MRANDKEPRKLLIRWHVALGNSITEDGTVTIIGHTLVGSRRRRDVGRRSTETLV